MAAIASLLLNVIGFGAVVTHGPIGAKPQVSRLVSLLPASDGVFVFDSKRFLDDALPKLLSANQPMLNEITTKITEIESRTGIDLRKLDQVAIGLAMKSTTEKGFDCEPVVIAGGDINAGAFIAMAKLASKGKYREEKIGDAAIFVFTIPSTPKPAPPNTAKTTSAPAKTSKIAHVIDQGFKGLATEVAVTSLDRNTLAIGCLDRVRETVEAKSHVSSDITNLLLAKETAVMSFALKTPGGMSKLVPLDNDELGANIDSIQYLSGSLDVAAAGTSLQLMARTAKPEQALALKDLLDALQIMGKIAFGSSKQADKMIYGRLIKNAKLDAHGNDVTLDLLVPQADIDLLVAKIK